MKHCINTYQDLVQKDSAKRVSALREAEEGFQTSF